MKNITTNQVLVIAIVASILIAVIGSAITYSPPTTEDVEKTHCYSDFFNPVWNQSFNWGIAIDKMKYMPEWKYCSKYVQDFINEKVVPASR